MSDVLALSTITDYRRTSDDCDQIKRDTYDGQNKNKIELY